MLEIVHANGMYKDGKNSAYSHVNQEFYEKFDELENNKDYKFKSKVDLLI